MSAPSVTSWNEDTLRSIANDTGCVNQPSVRRRFGAEADTVIVSQQLWYVFASPNWLRSVKVERASGMHAAVS